MRLRGGGRGSTSGHIHKSEKKAAQIDCKTCERERQSAMTDPHPIAFPGCVGLGLRLTGTGVFDRRGAELTGLILRRMVKHANFVQSYTTKNKRTADGAVMTC